MILYRAFVCKEFDFHARETCHVRPLAKVLLERAHLQGDPLLVEAVLQLAEQLHAESYVADVLL